MKQVCKYFHYKHPSLYVFHGHRHAEWELNIIISGCMEITAENSVERLFSGDGILIKANDFHQNRVVGITGAEMLVIHFIPEKKDECRHGLYKLSEDAAALIKLLINEAERNGITDCEVTEPSQNTEKLLELLLCELERSERINNNKSSKDADIYRCAVEFMKQNIDKNISIDDVARASGVCKTYLKRIFSYYTGMGCIRFFGEMKLEIAKKLLKEGQSCAYAAEALGFSSLAYFSKKYKELYGVSPSSDKAENPDFPSIKASK